MASMTSMPSIESMQEGKPYFSDETTSKILKYLEFSNLQYKLDNNISTFININNSNSNKYMVNLFCLYKIAEILKQVIDRKNANNNIFSSKSASGFSSYIPFASRISSYMPSMPYFRTKKTNPNTKKYNKKPNTKKNNKNSKTLITIKGSIEFIINNLILQQFNNYKNFISNANELTDIISIVLKNPIFFNQTIIHNINLKFNPEIINQQKLNNNLSKFTNKSTNKSHEPQINTTTQFKYLDEFYYIQDEYIDFNEKIAIKQQKQKNDFNKRQENLSQGEINRILAENAKKDKQNIEEKEYREKLAKAKEAKEAKEAKQKNNKRKTLLSNLKYKSSKTNKVTVNETKAIKTGKERILDILVKKRINGIVTSRIFSKIKRSK